MAYNWLDAWIADKQKRDQQAQQDAQTNKVNFHQASMANNIQYTLPNFTGTSGNKGVTSQWEQDMLKPLKGYGRSYDDRFSNLTKSLGMSDSQSQDFRRYMDAQEASQQQYKMKKDGVTPDNRHTVSEGQGMMTQNQQIDGILNNMNNPNTPTNQLNRAIQNVGIPDQQVPVNSQQNYNPSLYAQISAGGQRVGDQVLRTVFGNKFADQNAQDQIQSAKEDLKANPNSPIAQRNLYAAEQSINPTTSNVDKVLNNIGGVFGNVAPFLVGDGAIGGVKAGLGVVSKAVPSIGRLAADGALSGLVGSGIDSTAKATIGGEQQSPLDIAKNAALNAGIGAVANPLISKLAERVIGKVMTKSAQGTPVPHAITQTAQEEGIPEDVVHKYLNAYSNNPKFQTESSGQVIDTNVPKLNAPQPEPIQGLNGPTYNPNQLGNTPLGLNEPLYSKRVNGIGQDVQVQGTPQLNAPATGRPIQSQQELDTLLNDMLNTSHTRQVMEDQHVQEQLAPYLDSQHQQAQAEQTWNTTVKQAKDETNRIKNTFGKISVPKNALEDYPVPPQFRASSKDKGSDDIFKFADQHGFSSPDEAVQYLQHLDTMSKTKLKDLAPNDGIKLDDGHIQALTDAARKSFADTPHGQAIDSLLNDLMNIHQAHVDSAQTGEPLQFKKEIGVQSKRMAQEQAKHAVEYTGQLNPKDQSALRSEGSYSTKQVDSPFGDTLKINNINPKETPLEFKRQVEQQGMKTKGNKPISDRVTVKDEPKVGDTAYPLNAKGERMSEPKKVEAVHTAPDGRKFYQFEGSNTSVEHVEPVGSQKPFMKLDLQHFEDTTLPQMFTTDKPIESKTAIQSIKNPVSRVINKHIEDYMNSTHSAKVAHQQVLEKAIKENPTEELKAELKDLKRKGSSFEWSMANEKTTGNQTKTFLENHMTNLQKALGSKSEKDMANALRYQFAKNIDWIWKNVNPDYEVGGGWDRSFVTRVINDGANNTKLKSFTKAMKGLTQEWRDKALKENLINKTQHEALSRNPYYIPMGRDVSAGLDNIDRGMNNGIKGSKSQPGAYFIHKLGNGDAEAMYKNPLETIVKNSHSLFKNIAKNDTGREALRLAQMDKEGMFFKEVSKKNFNPEQGMAVKTAQGTKYVHLQSDLAKMYKENDIPLDLNVLGKITRAFSGAKVRSLQYQMTGVPRDIAEGYLKGQINNPFRYLKELALAAKNHNIDAKQAGAFFEHAHNDGMGDINPDKMVKEFAKQSGNVKLFDPKSKESWKGLVSTIGKIADMPFKPAKWLGQMSDELPRSVEVKITKENFMKKNGQKISALKSELNGINQQLDHASQATDPFDPRLQGIDELHTRKAGIEDQLNGYDRALRREQTYRGRDIMNFSQIGRSGIAKHIKQYAAFANTGTQSKYKLIRSLIERPIPTLVKAATLVAPLVYAEKVMQQNLTGKDKDLYNNTPDYIKQYNYVYVHAGKVYTLPKIQELALISDPIESLLTGDKSALNSSERNAVRESVPYQAGNFLQGLVPGQDGKISRQNFNSPLASTIFEPVTDIAANSKVGFNHNPISYADQFGRKNPKANSWTMDIYKGPLKNKPAADYAQYAVEQYGGDAGHYLEALLSVAKKPSDKTRIDQAIQMLNPAQDRAYGNIQVAGHQVFKSPYQKSKVTKK